MALGARGSGDVFLPPVQGVSVCRESLVHSHAAPISIEDVKYSRHAFVLMEGDVAVIDRAANIAIEMGSNSNPMTRINVDRVCQAARRGPDPGEHGAGHRIVGPALDDGRVVDMLVVWVGAPLIGNGSAAAALPPNAFLTSIAPAPLNPVTAIPPATKLVAARNGLRETSSMLEKFHPSPDLYAVRRHVAWSAHEGPNFTLQKANVASRGWGRRAGVRRFDRRGAVAEQSGVRGSEPYRLGRSRSVYSRDPHHAGRS
jgi:hypothetical protein